MLFSTNARRPIRQLLGPLIPVGDPRSFGYDGRQGGPVIEEDLGDLSDWREGTLSLSFSQAGSPGTCITMGYSTRRDLYVSMLISMGELRLTLRL